MTEQQPTRLTGRLTGKLLGGCCVILALWMATGVSDLCWHLVFGWIVFVLAKLPNVTLHWVSITVGLAAFITFVFVLQLCASAWYRRFITSNSDHDLDGDSKVGSSPSIERWKMRWTISIALLIVLMFASGTALVGITHQVVWIFTSEHQVVN